MYQLLVASYGAIQLYYKLDAQLAHFEFDKISNQREQRLSSEMLQVSWPQSSKALTHILHLEKNQFHCRLFPCRKSDSTAVLCLQGKGLIYRKSCLR